MADEGKTVRKTLRGLLKQRKGVDVAVDDDNDLYDDLMLDSLDVAELSAVLEDDLGSDPYSSGETPRTVGEIVEFYER